MGMKKSEVKRPRGRPKGSIRTPEEAWKHLPISQGGTSARIPLYVETAMIDRMQAVGDVLVKLEKKTPGSGIKQNTPGKFAKYCCEKMMLTIEKMIKDAANGGNQ